MTGKNKTVEDYANMSEAQVGVLAATWKWRIIKAGYKDAKDFCNSTGVSGPSFSRWCSGQQVPTARNIKRVEDFLNSGGK